MFRFLLFLFVVAVDAKLSAADPANLLFSQSDSQEDVVCPVDVAFIMDASGSQETVFRNEKEIVIGITKSMSIGVTKEKSRASLMHFSVLAEVDGLFGTYATATEFQRAVRGLLFLGRQTRIDRALAKASRKVFKKSSSSRPQIAVILTNGIQRSESQEIPKGLMEASQPLRNKGVRVIAVGITTDSSEKRLRLMTERDSDVVVDTNKSFVMNKVKLLFEDACIRYCLDQKMDIAILADTSRSMSEDQLKKLTELVETMIDQTDVSPEGSHYGFITFDREVKVHTTISNTEYYNKDDLKSLIGKIQELRKVDWGTRSDIALSEAKNKLFTADGGDRPDAKNFLFLFTDGKFFITGKDKKPFIPIENSTKALEKEKVKITIIAILGKSCRKSDAALQACNDSMKKMAGELGEVLMFEDFNDLVKRYQEVLDSLCHPLPAHSPGASVACKDKLRQCAFYAAKPNYCKNHPDYMGEHCPRSCNLCPAIY